MPIDDTYPAGYFESRPQMSALFLAHFDNAIKDQTPGIGTSLLTLFVFPIGLLANWSYGQARQALYNNLITIAANSERIALVDNIQCLNAVKNGAIFFEDLANCPMESLRLLLQPQILEQLRQDNRQVSSKTAELRNKLSELSNKEKNTHDNSLRREFQAEAQQVQYELDKQVTLLQQLRKYNYSLTFIHKNFKAKVIDAVPQPITHRNSNKSGTAQPPTIFNRNDTTTSNPSSNKPMYHRNTPFLIDILAHPASFAVSAAFCVGGLLVLGLVSPLPLSLAVTAIIASATGVGFFAASCAALSMKNSPEDDPNLMLVSH